jgi:hypothetical protein
MAIFQTAVLLLGTAFGVLAQGPQGPDLTGPPHQPLTIVDFPTAGLPPRATFESEIDVYGDGGVLLTLGVGFARYFAFGISYGGLNVIGSGDPDMNPEPAVFIKARILDETIMLPALAIGFDSQGYGRYFDDLDRYLVKSRGVFAVASKNWELLGPLSLHGGISYSLEDEDDDDPTVFLGLIKSFGDFIDVRGEFDFALNDNEGFSPLTENRGYLNAAVVWHVNENFSISVEVRDIATEDKIDTDDLREWNRGLSISYHDVL